MVSTPAIEFMKRGPPKPTAYVTVDECGDLGGTFDGEFYIIAATVIDDRDRFIDSTKRFGFNTEMKFRRNTKRRKDVLDYADPSIRRVYWLGIRKDRPVIQKNSQHILHRNGLFLLSQMITKMEPYPMDVEIDRNTLIEDRQAELIFSGMEGRSQEITAHVVDSKENHGIQSHDFIAGMIGRHLNRTDNEFYDRVKASKYGMVYSADYVESLPTYDVPLRDDFYGEGEPE